MRTESRFVLLRLLGGLRWWRPHTWRKLLAENYFDNVAAEPAALARAIQTARKAALADPEGRSLAVEIAKSSAALAKPQRQFATAAE